MPKLDRGYIQIYTGNGKGKTTAALGQGMRASGDGLIVFMVQFLKGRDTGELHTIKKLEPNFKLFRFERPRGFFWTLNDEEKKELKNDIDEAFNFCFDTVEQNNCDVLILDEVMGVIKNNLTSVDKLLELLDKKPEGMEMILTGRDVPQKIADKADLITEMKEIKHYFNAGVPSRKGIEY